MSNSSRPHLVFTITSGWAIRNFIQSGVIDRLSRNADLSLAVTHALKPYFAEMVGDGQIRALLAAPESEPVTHRLVRQARKAVFQAVHRVATARIKRVSSDNVALRALQRFSWTLQCGLAARWQLDFLDILERKVVRSSAFSVPVGTTILINTSPFDPRDNQVQRAMQRAGVKTLAVIPSWDNPSSKGCILPDTDSVLVWSPVQKAEMLSYYPKFDESQLVISGIPQFDVYSHTKHFASDHNFLSNLGIPPGKKIILFSTSSPKLFQHEPIVLRHMADALDAGRFGPDVHILVRCHPVDDAERYAELAGRSCVTIFPSSLESGAALATWRPPESELEILATTLRHCAVCVNTASTMTLDAASSGRPVVNIAYDAGGPQPPHRSVRRFYSYSHYAKVVAAGYAAVAASPQSLIDYLATALAGGQDDENERANFVAAFCPTPSGGSVAFIADYIDTMARQGRGEATAHDVTGRSERPGLAAPN